MPKKLELYRSLDPQSMSLGWERDDIPNVVHVIVKARQGEKFEADSHYPCGICADHDYTVQDFHNEVKATLERGPAGG